jgi:hypothetical protein
MTKPTLGERLVCGKCLHWRFSPRHWYARITKTCPGEKIGASA